MISLVALTLLSQPAAAESLEVGKPAPEFALTDLEGNAVKLSDHKGKVVILEWFNPGCPYVVYAHEEGPLKAMAQKYDAREDMVWLAINSGAEGKQGHGLDSWREWRRKRTRCPRRPLCKSPEERSLCLP